MDRTAFLFDPGLYADTAVMRGSTLPGVIANAVARFPDAEAVIDGDVRLTYAALDRRASVFAAALSSRGIGPGSVVALHLPNGWEFICAAVAIARIGAVAMPLHPPYRRHELHVLLAAAEAEAIVCSAAALDNVRAFTGARLTLIVCTGPHTGAGGDVRVAGFDALLIAHANDSAPSSTVAPGDLLSLNPTSGTESLQPQICMHTHDGLLSNSAALAERAGYTHEDRVLITGGFTHLFGMAGVQMTLIAGATLHVLATFDADAWLDVCEREAITRAWVVPPHLGVLLDAQARRPRALALNELRTGGTAIDARLAARVRAALCDNFVIQWGTSEICGGATTVPGGSFEHPTLGTPIAGAELRFLDGELWYRRADMFRGYLGEPERTAVATSADGFVRTGDLTRLAPDGSILFEGRTKDIINRGGVKISAFELEALLAPLAAIRQLAVVAYPDERLSERTALVCSLQPGAALDLGAVIAHLDALHVAKYKWPEKLIVLDALPVTPTGKVAKSAVRALVAQSLATQELSAQAPHASHEPSPEPAR